MPEQNAGSMPVLVMEQITKSFPGVLAVDRVDLQVDVGEVLALIGENGAGKSTLMKILSGAQDCDAGRIYVDGKLVEHYTPRQAIECGISVIYQELNYINYMTVAENIFLGSIPLKNGLVDHKELARRSRDIQAQVGLEYLSPSTPLHKLSVGEKQLVEIAKAYARNVRIIVMDEPTSALNERECEKLFALIDQMRQEGKAVIYISHKLDEVLRVSDTVQVMRDGRSVGRMKTKDTTKDQMISLMVGRSIADMYPIHEREIGDVLLQVRDMSGEFIRDIGFDLHRGEIVGLFSLMGGGSDEVVRSLFGALPTYSKKVFIGGREVAINTPADAIKNGIAYVPSERKTEGLILASTVKKNATLLLWDQLAGLLGFDNAREEKLAQEWIGRLSIKTPSSEVKVETLSGGNQQKVVLAKWMMNRPQVLILNEPTRGIDVGAKVEIYKIIESFCREGLGVIMVSSEMAEVMSTSDRILAIHNGRIRGEFSRKEATQEGIMKKAIGE